MDVLTDEALTENPNCTIVVIGTFSADGITITNPVVSLAVSENVVFVNYICDESTEHSVVSDEYGNVSLVDFAINTPQAEVIMSALNDRIPGRNFSNDGEWYVDKKDVNVTYRI